MVNNLLITTANSLEGYKVNQQLGIVRGITVRSRSVFGNLAGHLQSMVGGELSVYVELCEKARQDAYMHMIDHANMAGANAIICMRYDANDVMEGVTEVLCYGTAVIVEKI